MWILIGIGAAVLVGFAIFVLQQDAGEQIRSADPDEAGQAVNRTAIVSRARTGRADGS